MFFLNINLTIEIFWINQILNSALCTGHNLCVWCARFGFADKPQGSFEKMAEIVVNPLMKHEIILTENDAPGAKLTKDLKECNVDQLKHWLECRGQNKVEEKQN